MSGYIVEIGSMTNRNAYKIWETDGMVGVETESFQTLEEARAGYGSVDLAGIFDTERACRGGLSLMMGDGFYKELQVVEGDEVVDVVEFDSYTYDDARARLFGG